MGRGPLGIVLAALLAGAAIGCAGPGHDADYFRGRTLTVIVPNGPGGMDTYARTIAPYFQRYLPGSKVRVINVPDEGGIAGRNQVYAAAPDGLTLGFCSSGGSLLAEWAGQPGMRYKTAGFSLIGRINAEANIMVVSPKTGLASLDDIIRAKKIRMGFAGLGSDDYYVAMVAARLLGFQVDARIDFTSSFDAGLACVKGEVDAILFPEASVQPLIKASTVLPVAVFGLARLGSMPGVPTIFEGLDAERQKIMQALVRFYALDRTLFAPPDIPPGRLKALREALDRTMAEPEFRHDMDMIQRPVSYLTGAETAGLLESILSREGQIKPLVLEIAHAAK